ncbi:CsxC family protein [Thalassobacillus hwangdonensis]|uniref:CsxC family protein n=1 Tax=Thalassobacillus hwangdonensis TaxID=546108 RepID=A0ABW3KXP4_9BACI
MHKDKDCLDVNVSATVNDCENESVDQPTIDVAGEELLVRVPVTLAQVEVSTSLSANIRFPDPVMEIKDMKKRVKIVQCKLLIPGTPSTTDDPFIGGDYKLFIKGFIRKNIQYVTPGKYSTKECVNGDLRSHTVDVPFECVTTIAAESFIRNPQLPFYNSRNEFDFYREQMLGKGYPEKDKLLSSDLSQFHQDSTQFYNQMPYCELVASRMTSYDESTDRESLPGHAPFEEGYFYHMVEKMFLEFQVKVLQVQQVDLNS